MNVFQYRSVAYSQNFHQTFKNRNTLSYLVLSDSLVKVSNKTGVIPSDNQGLKHLFYETNVAGIVLKLNMRKTKVYDFVQNETPQQKLNIRLRIWSA